MLQTLSTPALLGLGLVLGMRHALEPDHLAAVSTLVAANRPRGFVAAFLGAFWGLGHTLAILLFGGGLLLLRIELPETAQAGLELAVAAMLIFLGGRGLLRAYRLNRTPGPHHSHAGIAHDHAGALPHVHLGPFVLGVRPLLIGLVHGLAGTGALTSLVMATLPTPLSALSYFATFGLGSLVGMALMTFAAGTSIGRLRSRAAEVALLSFAGLGSLGYGLYWGAVQLSALAHVSVGS